MTPVQTNPADHVNTLDDSTIQQAQANALFAVTNEVNQFNSALKASYLTAFSNWAISVSAGRLDNTNPPQPPIGYAVGTFADPTTGPGSTGVYQKAPVMWPYPVQNGGPVCDMPPVPGVVHHTLGKGQIGVAIPNQKGWFSEIPGDTTPDNVEGPGTSQDGVTGIFRKIASPFGSDINTGAVGGWFYLVRSL